MASKRSMGVPMDYRFTGDVNGLEARIPVHVTEARVETDKRGDPYVVAQLVLPGDTQPVEVTMTIEQALEAGIIERVE